MLKRLLFILLHFQLLVCIPVDGVQAQTVDELKAQLKEAKAESKSFKVQHDSLKYCLKEARYYTNDKQSYNFDKARQFLKQAFANPLGKDNVDVILQAAQTEYQCFQTERNKPASNKKIDEKVIYSSTAAGFEYYMTAYDRLMKGERVVKAKQLQELRSNAYDLYRATRGFRATAGYYYTKQDWKQAYKYFHLGLEALDSQILNDFARYNGAMALDFDRFNNDSARHKLMYSCAVTAVKMGDHLLAIRELEQVKHCGIETNLCYQQLCLEYKNAGNMEGFERTLLEAMEVLPNEIWYPQNLLNLYLSRHQLSEALPVAESLVQLAPDNAANYELKGRLQEEVNDIAGAEQAYMEALKRDPLLLLSNENLGRIYFNQAVAQEDAFIEARRFEEIYDKVVPLYEKALPYYYKAYESDLKREEKTIATAIRTILYKRFQNPRCKETKALIAKYNEVSKAYGLPIL